MSDMISSPEHYTYGKIEPKDVVIDWRLDFFLGNVVKYICRAGKKDGTTMIEDLQKARQYIDFEIEQLRNDKSEMPQSSTQRRGVFFTNASSTVTENDLREAFAFIDDGK